MVTLLVALSADGGDGGLQSLGGLYLPAFNCLANSLASLASASSVARYLCTDLSELRVGCVGVGDRRGTLQRAAGAFRGSRWPFRSAFAREAWTAHRVRTDGGLLLVIASERAADLLIAGGLLRALSRRVGITGSSFGVVTSG